jgi:hypothetical protein
VLRPVLLAFVLALPLAACGGDRDFRPFAKGNDTEVYAVVDSTDWNGAIGEAVRETAGGVVRTLPAPEDRYQVVPGAIDTEARWEEVRANKNLVVAASFADSTFEASILRAYFSDDVRSQLAASGEGAVVVRPDVWRRGQTVVFATGPTDEAVAQALRARDDSIDRGLERGTRAIMQRDMFDRGRQTNLEDTLMQNYDFAVNVQHDFFIARSDPDFVWLRRVLTNTWRSVFVHYQEGFDPSRLTPEFARGLRDSLTAVHMEGTQGGFIQVDDRLPFEVAEVDFNGRYALEMRGVWAMMSETDDGRRFATMAGPFVSYVFYDEAQDRLYLIDGMVFAPNNPKLPFLRQVEVIAQTFRTRAEQAPPA